MSERRTLPEQVGLAFHASSLRIEAREPGAESSLLRVAALGAAVLHVQHGADRTGRTGRGGPVAEVLADPLHVPRELDQVVGELGGLLWHIRYGGQDGCLHQAIVLLANYVARRGRFMQSKALHGMAETVRAQLLERYAGRLLHEWLSDRCVACGGTGKLERAESGSWVRPRGRMQRNATFRVCPTCHGSRRAMPSHTARRKALEISLEIYELHGWAQHFRAGLAWLDLEIARRIKRPLTAQLERGTNQP